MLGSFNTGQTISNAASDAVAGYSIALMAGGPAGAIAGGALFAGQLIASLVDQNGPKKLAATEIANNAMYAAQVNVSEWRNYPPNMKTKALQVEYLNNFLKIWGYLTQGCSDPNLGSAGQRCISERDHNGIYDYWAGYYDPILNDPEVYDPTVLPQALAVNNQAIQATTIANPVTGGTLINFVEQNPMIDLAILGGIALVLLM
jgi:hypothetical protein